MLSFKAHHLAVRGRDYLLLPKLNREQVRVIREHLVTEGLSVTGESSLVARSSRRTIHVDPMGLCWSSSDPSDYLLPAMPNVLACKKEICSPGEILAKYFRLFSGAGHYALKVTTRLESLGNWDGLRSSGVCGLAPDEHLLIRRLLNGSGGECHFVTDYAVDGSLPFCSGARLYFDASLPSDVASNTLRTVGAEKRSNSYLPRDGILNPSSPLPAFPVASLEDLGDWCSFITGQRESSNGRLGWPPSAPVV